MGWHPFNIRNVNMIFVQQKTSKTTIFKSRYTKNMFRQTARFASRVASSQQRRAFSSQNAQHSVAPKKFAAVVGGSILLWIAFKPSESQNAGFFSGSAQPVDIKKVRTDIADAIEAEDAKRGDGTSIGPTLVRLAWHASGTYSIFDKTGGSNGATMRFKPDAEWGANAGLKVARDFVEQIVKKHPGLSVADAWTLAGVVAIEVMGGPVIPWRAGRKDATSAPTAANSLPNGRLPNADMGCPAATNSHIRDIFGRMGFSDREIVALTGAHALGRCHENASGYWGPWTRAESTFSNEFFNVLLNEKWTPKTTHNGKPWQGPAQYESKDGALMMLPSDMALLEDKAFRPFVELYAKDEEVFFKDFSAAFAKLTELGVSFPAK